MPNANEPDYPDFPFSGDSNKQARKQLLSGGFLPVPVSLLGTVKPLDLFVLGSLLNRVRPEGAGKCFPGQRMIARELWCRYPTVNLSLRRLREQNLVAWETTRSTNAYYIQAPGLAVKKSPRRYSQSNLAHKKHLLKKGFIPVPTYLFLLKGLSSSDVLVLSYLLKCVGSSETGRCYPSVRTIAKYTGRPLRAVSRALQRLQGRDLISRQPPCDTRTTRYFVHLSAEIVEQIRAQKPNAKVEVTNGPVDETGGMMTEFPEFPTTEFSY